MNRIVLAPEAPRLLMFPLVLATAVVVVLAGCGDTYCQSGPKHGTQCYDPPQGDDPPFPRQSSNEDEQNRGAEPEPGRTLPATAPR